MDKQRIIEIAVNYRQRNERPEGVVLIWDDEAYGWKDRLRNAEHERPGAIAVDPQMNIYQAQGGDDYNGAKHWVVA
jgi:hypothetical protein